MQNTMSPDQKRRKEIDSWVCADIENFRIAKRYYFERTRLGTKGIRRADLATRLMRLGATVGDLQLVKVQNMGRD